MTIQTKSRNEITRRRNSKHKELIDALLGLGPEEALFVQPTEKERNTLPSLVSRIGKRRGIKFTVRVGEYKDEQGVVIYHA